MRRLTGSLNFLLDPTIKCEVKLERNRGLVLTTTPVFAASGALGISSIFNDSAGHSSFHVGIIRDMALGL